MFIRKDISDLIYRRTSTRTFSGERMDDARIQKIESYISDMKNQEGIFGFVRFELVENINDSIFGAYGHISGARHYIAAISKDSREALLDVGYAFQKLMLFAENIGLGTCWLAATSFDRNAAELAIPLEKNEIIAAISPIGEKAATRSEVDLERRKEHNSNNRLDFDVLFTDAVSNGKIEDEELRSALELVRAAPSALNNQPWRAAVENDTVHFYVTSVTHRIMDYEYEMMDIGAALFHFSAATGKNGFFIKPPFYSGEHEYVISVK